MSEKIKLLVALIATIVGFSEITEEADAKAKLAEAFEGEFTDDEFEGAVAIASAQMKQAAIIAEIGKLDPNDKAHYTSSKIPKPHAGVLGERLKFPVSAKERDEAFALYLEQNPPAADPAVKEDTGIVTCEDVIKNLRKQGKRI